MNAPFAFHHFAGTHHEVGLQHGLALAEPIRLHLERVERRLAANGATLADGRELALRYRSAVQEVAPGFDEELVGLAEGSGLGLGGAYLLQLRAEVFAALTGRHGGDPECTTFAVQPERAGGGGLVGQNADLPEMYLDLLQVVRIAVAGQPEVLMVTPAGQISYIGLNDRGLGVFGNYLHSDDWRVGFPRYFYSRLALTQATTAEALELVAGLRRSSSRNLIMLDASGDAADLENTIDEVDVLRPAGGVLAHSNHYLSERLRPFERTPWLENSEIRLSRMLTLLGDAERLDPQGMAAILRDRDDPENALSIHPEDSGPDDGAGSRNTTVTSVIAEPAHGRIWVSDGPPSRSRYRSYAFAEAPGAATIELPIAAGGAR